MKKLVGFLLSTVGIVVYFGLLILAIVRLVTGNGDPLVPFIGFIMISGFSVLFTLVRALTEAVAALVSATTEEVALLLNMSDTNSLLGKVPQKDQLN